MFQRCVGCCCGVDDEQAYSGIFVDWLTFWPASTRAGLDHSKVEYAHFRLHTQHTYDTTRNPRNEGASGIHSSIFAQKLVGFGEPSGAVRAGEIILNFRLRAETTLNEVLRVLL